MPVRTQLLDRHPSGKPLKGIIVNWWQSGGVINGDLNGTPVVTSRVVRRYRIGKSLYVETERSVYALQRGLRWGRQR